MTQLLSKYSDKYTSNIKSEILDIDDVVKSYTSFAESKFMNDVKSVEPNAYFDNGTKLISLIVKAYNTNNKALLEDSKGWF